MSKLLSKKQEFLSFTDRDGNQHELHHDLIIGISEVKAQWGIKQGPEGYEHALQPAKVSIALKQLGVIQFNISYQELCGEAELPEPTEKPELPPVPARPQPPQPVNRQQKRALKKA